MAKKTKKNKRKPYEKEFHAKFNRLKVSVISVDYDFDGMEEDEIAQAQKKLPQTGTIDLGFNELLDLKIVKKDGDCWILDESELEDWIGEKITADTEFCHNGVLFRYTISP